MATAVHDVIRRGGLPADREVFGIEQIVVSSASSKTAMGIAFLLAPGLEGLRLVGLTSLRNVAFTKRTGYYAPPINPPGETGRSGDPM